MKLISLTIAAMFVLSACVNNVSSPAESKVPTIGQDPVFSDQIAAGASDDLEGHYLKYEYVTGSKYRLSFADGYVTAKEIDSPRPRVVRAYLAREMREGQYLVHWMAQDPSGNDRKGHIALVLDFGADKVHGTAVLPNGMQIFDTGTIFESSIP